MIKRTLYFGNPAYLSMKLQQLVISLPDKDKDNKHTIPIEDVGVIVIDNPQITITHALLDQLVANNCAVISCNKNHMPSALFMPLDGNSTQSERFNQQINASIPLKKQLWQQTIQAKIRNQAAILRIFRNDNAKNMLKWASEVRSGDSENVEARAAVYYWKNLFPTVPNFIRGQEEDPPNNLLNYGYSILRAIIARALVSTGLLPTFGIHHHNRYNAYCLADDIMEPFRPYVDKIIIQIVDSGTEFHILNTEIKRILLSIPTTEVTIEGKRSPLMIAASTTATSLYKCFSNQSRKIIYPEI